MDNIKCLIILSGKRFSGKDYCGEKIESVMGILSNLNVKFDHPTTQMKKLFASEHKLDFNKLMVDRLYKESNRIAMTNYSDAMMEIYGVNYYNQLFIQNVLYTTTIPSIYIIDCRYQTGIDLYKSLGLKLILIRINTDDSVRIKRGWSYVEETDQHKCECDLDLYEKFDLKFNNNTDNDDNLLLFINNDLWPKIKN